MDFRNIKIDCSILWLILGFSFIQKKRADLILRWITTGTFGSRAHLVARPDSYNSVVFVSLDGLLSQAREMQNGPLSQAREKRTRGSFLAVQAQAGAGERMGCNARVFSSE
jgi:hypothetical protein